MKLSVLMNLVRAEKSQVAWGVVALLDNAPAQRIAAAWALMPRPLVEAREGSKLAKLLDCDVIELLDEKDAADVLDALWGSTYVDFGDLSNRTGIDRELVVALFYQLSSNRVVYPDGTIHERAAAYLDQLTVGDTRRDA